MGYRGYLLLLLLLLSCLLSPTNANEPPHKKDKAKEKSPKLTLNLRGIRVYVPLRRVEVEGVVNLRDKDDLIELLATAPKGKEHESILVLNCNPALLNSALFLIGLNQGRGNYAKDSVKLRGDTLYIYVKWKEKGQEKIFRAEELIWDKKHNRVMPYVRWVFTGSQFILDKKTGKPVFAANVEGVLVATYYDPNCIINNPLPERNDDTVYYANPKVLPGKNTPVTVIFSVKPLSISLPQKQESSKNK